MRRTWTAGSGHSFPPPKPTTAGTSQPARALLAELVLRPDLGVAAGGVDAGPPQPLRVTLLIVLANSRRGSFGRKLGKMWCTGRANPVSLDDRDEFANRIFNGTENWNKLG
jgi:hypothetical protein